MGSRNLDRIPLHQRRHLAEGVGDMFAQHWKVQAWCGKCGVKLEVDLTTIAAVRGARFSLWDKRSRCRVVGCGGAVRFFAEAPGRPGFSELVSPKPDPDGLSSAPRWIAKRGAG